MQHTPRSAWRRAAALAAVLAVGALGVAACGDDDESSSSSSGSSSGSSEGGNLTLIAGVKGDEFYITMNCGAQEEAKKLGYTLDFQGPDQFDPAQQTPVVSAVTAKKPDGVLVAPTDTKAMYAPISRWPTTGRRSALVDTTLDQRTWPSPRSPPTTSAAAREAAKALRPDGREARLRRERQAGHLDDRPARPGLRGLGQGLGLTYLGQRLLNNQPEKAAAIVEAQLAEARTWRASSPRTCSGPRPPRAASAGGQARRRQDRRLRRPRSRCRTSRTASYRR